MLENILQALPHLVDPFNLLLMIGGLAGGIIIGALPGLTATMGVALMVPATFSLDAIPGLLMLGAIYVGAIYGGANAACLICTPGTPSSVATTFDAWPLCQKGRADVGLNTSLLSSSFGGIIGTLLLLFLAAPLARFALNFGGPENLWLCLFGLSTIAAMSTGNLIKGLLSGALGLLVATIGIDPHTAYPRFTFGTYALVQGVEVIPAMIGLFSISQVLVLIGSHKPHIAEYQPTPGVFWKVLKKLTRDCKMILLRSSLIGGLVGMLPGAGGEIASIIAYNESKRWDKEPSRYGTGVEEGVAASESANNAVIGGALIPMFTLGIPGSAVAAVILGALMAKGIQPGFKVFTVSGDLTYAFITSQFVVNLLMIPVGFILARFMAKLLAIRLTFVAIGIVVLSVIGSYAIRNSMLDVGVALAFGGIGYLCSRSGLDTGTMALGIILGPMIEENLGKCFQLAKSEGSVLNVFANSPIALFLIVMTLLSVISPYFLNKKRKIKTVVPGQDMDAPAPVGEDPAWKDFLAVFFTMLVIAAFAAQTSELDELSFLFPLCLLVFLTAGSVLLFGRGFRRMKRWGLFPDEGGERPQARKVIVMAAGALLYALAIMPLGFYPATALFLFGMSYYQNSAAPSRLNRLGMALVVTGLLCALVWFGFTYLLSVPTPASILFEAG